MLISTSFTEPGLAKKTKSALLTALRLKDEWDGPLWPLPNAKEVTESEYWGWRTSYSFKAEVWTGQKRYEGRWGHLLLYWVNSGHLLAGGFAVLVLRNDYPKPNTIRYFEWRACAHEFSSKTTGNCQHLYTCKKCGASYEVDSSG